MGVPLSPFPHCYHLKPGAILTEILKYICNFFLDEFLVLKSNLNFPKLVLYFSHYLINSFKFTADEIMAKVQHHFQGVKMDFKTKNSFTKSYIIKKL